MSVRRGRPSNRAHGAVFRETVLAIVRDKYTDFGPTLVKVLRLVGVAGIDDGNALLPAFVADYNRRFGKPPRSDKDVHRALAPQDDLDRSFAWRERTVTNTPTVQYDRVLFILEPSALTRPLARTKVSVFDYPDGRIEIRHQGLALPYRTFDRISRID